MDAQSSAQPAGRIKLLDSAEELFARVGYDSASLRGITRRAGVELGLSGYHFRNKDELFRQVLRRRAPDMAQALDEALGRALIVGADKRDVVRGILHAYVEPHLDRLHSEDEGWRNYIRLAAFSALFLARPELTAAAGEIYQPVMERFRAALGRALPHVDPASLDRCYYVFRMAILSMSIDNVDPLAFGGRMPEANGQTTLKSDLVETVVDIYAAGFLALDTQSGAVGT